MKLLKPQSPMVKVVTLILLLCLLPSAFCFADGTPTIPATQAEVNAGLIHNKYVAPDTMAGFPFIATNLSPATMTNVANAKANTASNNLIVTTWGSYTNVVVFSGGPPVAGQAFVITGTNANGSVTVQGTNWPTGGGGSSFPLSGDVSAGNHAINDLSQVGVTNASLVSETFLKTSVIDSGHNSAVVAALTANTSGSATFSEFAANYFAGAHIGDGSSLTNLTNANIVLAGNNITLTATTNGPTGKITFTVALSDPVSLSQANIGTTWLTNTVAPTNAVTGTVVDMSKGYGETNLSGNITYTDVSGVTAGAYNAVIRRLFSGGADRTVAFPASWHTNFNFIGVVTNGWTMDLLVTVTASRTNVDQILNP